LAGLILIPLKSFYLSQLEREQMGAFEKLIFPILKNHIKRNPLQKVPVKWERVKRIGVFSNSAIGDTLFSTPIFKILKSRFPEKEIIALLNPSNASLFQTNPNIDRVFLYSGKSWDFWKKVRELKKLKIDLVIIGHSNEPQATPLGILAGAKWIIKTPNHKNPFREFHSHPPVKPIEGVHGLFSRLEGLKLAGVEFSPNRVRPELYLKSEWQQEAQKVLNRFQIGKKGDSDRQKSGIKVVGFQIGASTLSRRWYPERWIELGKKFLTYYPKGTILLVGGPGEKKVATQIYIQLFQTVGKRKRDDIPPVINLTGKLSLPVATALLGELDLLISPDTGPLHLAATLGTPTIGLFVVAHPSGSNPFWARDKHLYLYQPRTCPICIAKKCKIPFCMLQLTPTQLFGTIRYLLSI